MTISLTFKRKPGTKEKDQIILLKTKNLFNLERAKILWEFEQLINGYTDTRIHVQLEE